MTKTLQSKNKNQSTNGRIRQENEQKILTAAEIEFAEHGFKGTSMNDIAARAGLPKANIHYYFGSKESLYITILENILARWDQPLHEMTVDDDPAKALSHYIHHKIQFARQYPYASRLFAKEILSGAPRLQNHFNHEYHRWFKSRTDVFDAWIAQGKIAPIDSRHLLFLLWSSTQHYADFHYQIIAALHKKKLTARDYKQASQTLANIILRGCGLTDTSHALNDSNSQ